jgi:predicted nucleic acid-binding protein
VSYLVDTNVLSEVRKGDAANANVRRWLAAVADEDIYVPAIVFGEIRRGVERVRHRGDLSQASALEQWLVQLETVYASRVVPVDVRVADTWGRLQVPDPLPVVDALLAATAIVHGLTFVTRNIADVARAGAQVLNPFEAGTQGALPMPLTRR